jgi:hypothetical protein
MTSDNASLREYASGFVLSDAQSQEWARFAYTARACELVLKRVSDPKTGSLFDHIDRVYDKEKASIWTRSYLRAAAEHLCLWSDLTAPYVIAPGMVSLIRLRPYLLLGRAALESASYALWVLAAPQSVDEWVSRFVQLMAGDFKLHRKALIDGGLETARIDERISALDARLAELSMSKPQSAPGYLSLVKHAATAAEGNDTRWGVSLERSRRRRAWSELVWCRGVHPSRERGVRAWALPDRLTSGSLFRDRDDRRCMHRTGSRDGPLADRRQSQSASGARCDS